MRPNDEQLELDVNEVQACLSATDSTSLKSMGDKRFKAKVPIQVSPLKTKCSRHIASHTSTNQMLERHTPVCHHNSPTADKEA